MKHILLLILLTTNFTLFSQNDNFEDNFEDNVKEISREIERVTLREKTFLKDELKEIKLKLEHNEITQERADSLKMEAAKKHAKAIEEKIAVLQEELEVLVENKANKEISSPSQPETIEEEEETIFDKVVTKEHRKHKKHWNKEKINSRRTTSQFVFSYGINNVINNHQIKSLDNSNYKLWKSHFYEMGGTYKTRISNKPSSAYIKYGFSFLWNLLRTEDNMYHAVNGDLTTLEVHTENLSESKLRNVQIIFPAHLEFDLSKNTKNSQGQKTEKTHKSVRIGLGGYVGAKISTKQKLKYKNDAGHKVKEYQKGDFNSSNFTYGLSTYIAYKSVGLYAKYDLSPLFKDTEIRNVSMGVRFDFN